VLSFEYLSLKILKEATGDSILLKVGSQHILESQQAAGAKTNGLASLSHKARIKKNCAGPDL
jgi:hypothetical protein